MHKLDNSEQREIGAFEQRFHQTLMDTYPSIIKDLEALRLLQWKGDALTLTDQGKLLGNEVFMRFVAN